jgi:hypothetical protein
MAVRSPLARKSVQKLHDPLGIRIEHIVDSETLFYLRPRYDKTSPDEYVLKEHFDDSTVFTVTGEKFGDTSAREFRDNSGLPMFECHRTWKG